MILNPVTQSYAIFPGLGAAELKPLLDGLMKLLIGYSESKKTIRLVTLKEGQDLLSATSLHMVGLSTVPSRRHEPLRCCRRVTIIEKKECYHER